MTHPGKQWQAIYQQANLSWYDENTVTPQYLERWVRSEWIMRMLHATKLRHSPSHHRVLEAGCGTGMYSVCLAMLGFSVDAFDYNIEALKIAQDLTQKIHCAGYDLNLRFYQQNLLSISIASDTYNLVFNQAVLEYFIKGYSDLFCQVAI